MNNIELNAVLYYADFLSLKTTNKPVTDNCKYYFVHNVPINSAFIVDLEPEYNTENPFYQQSKSEYLMLRDKFGDEGVMTFLENICHLKARGTVNAKQMLRCIHQYSTKIERKQAFASYYHWLDGQKYTHKVEDEDGNTIDVECSRYVSHFERSRSK